MAAGGRPFEAEQGDASPLGQVAEYRGLRDGLRKLELPGIDAAEHGEVVTPRRRTSFGGCAERLEPDIVDTGLAQACGQDILGESGTTRQRHRPDVGQYLHLGFAQAGDELGLGYALIADREDPREGASAQDLPLPRLA